MSGTERRSRLRFHMRLPLIARWSNGPAVDEVVSESKNFSSRGVYFFLPKSIKTGSPVEVVATLPQKTIPVGPVKVRCRGYVLRIEAGSAGKVGVAAVIKSYEFVRGDGNAALSQGVHCAQFCAPSGSENVVNHSKGEQGDGDTNR